MFGFLTKNCMKRIFKIYVYIMGNENLYLNNVDCYVVKSLLVYSISNPTLSDFFNLIAKLVTKDHI